MKQAIRERSGDIVKRPDASPPSLEVQWFGVSWREGLGYLAGAVLLAVVMSASGAFDTDEIGVAHRMVLWLVTCGLMVVQALVLDGLIAPRVWPGVAGRISAGLAAVLGVVALMTVELHALKYTPLLPKAPDPLGAFFLFLLPPVGAVAGFVVLMRILAPEGLQVRRAGAGEQDQGQPGDSQDTGRPEPAGWPREPVLRIRAHDHYLEITTASRRCFVRGRMSDALQRVATADGVQPHRSWWVARPEILRVRRHGRDYLIETRDGIEIPVGRTRIEAMREAGVLSVSG